MPFISSTDGDLKSVFITDAWLLDQYVGNSLLAWGLNSNGQIGDNGTSSYSLPTQTVATGINWKQASAGDKHTVGVKTDGTLWTWGNNAYGQLGDNSLVHRLSPVQTFAGGTNWNYVGSGWNHNIATKTDGTLWVWGRNNFGQLGNQNTTNSLLPKQILGTDPAYNQNVLLIRADGTNNGQNNTFLDSSSNNFAITRNGNTTQGTFNPFGTNWSNYFDGNGDYLSGGSNTNLAIGTTEDWTIECWVNFNTTGYGAWFQTTNNINSASGQIWFGYYTGGLTISQHGSNTYMVSYSWTPTIGVWYHVAATRTSGTTRLFINGNIVTTSTIQSGLAFTQSGWAIGVLSTPAYFAGYISNLRFVRGTSLYSSTFTPPTSNLTKIANVQFLTCRDNRFIDNSNDGNAITRNGDVSVTNFGPFLPTSEPIANSGYFDGNGDYLTAADNAAFEFGSGAFTIECWVYFTSLKGYQAIVSKPGTADGYGWNLYLESNNELNFIAGNGSWTINIGNTTPTPGQWYHIAVARDTSNNWNLFVNGKLDATQNNSFSNPDFSTLLHIGRYPYFPSPSATQDLGGYISSLRILKGTALYTNNFIPPTGPLTAITNTSLLLNFSNANIFDATGMNDLETVGDAKVSTSVVKYGTGSIVFDGTGDYLQIPDSPQWHFGSGAFTIEFWYRPVALTLHMLVQQGATSGNRWILYFDATNGMSFDVVSSSSTIIACRQGSTSGWSVNTWYHVAIVRFINTFSIYRDGILIANILDTDSIPDFAASLFIGGGNIGGDVSLNGYIDDLKIMKGFAKYTSNFLPPAQGSPDDPYYNQTVLLLSGNGNDAGNNSYFLDSSSNNFAVTRNGNTTQGSFSPYGTTWSNYFDGSLDYLQLASNAAFAMGTGDFTFEAWINPASWSASVVPVFVVSAVGGLWIGKLNSNFVVRAYSVADQLQYSAFPSVNTWTHIAVTRNGTTLRLYYNGILVASTTNSYNFAQGLAYIGSDDGSGGGSSFFAGYISNLRVVKSAVYSANFVPPYNPLTSIASTSLLTCQSNRFIDNSTNNFTITKTGDVRVANFSPYRISTNEVTTASKLPLGYFSNYFDGTGDYLTLSPGTAFQFGTGDFTVECWAFRTSTTAAAHYYYIDARNNSQTNLWCLLYENSANRLCFYNGTSYAVTSSTIPPDNSWYHVAYTRSGTTGRLFLNGTQIGTATDNYNYNISPTLSYVGSRYSLQDLFQGYLTNLRVVKGTALYTGNFTAPTAPFTAIPNTQLLTCQASRLLDASTNNFTITRYGDVSVQSFVPFAATTIGNYPIVNGSAFFDGASDYLSLPTSSAFQFGTGNFTLEFWVYKTGTSETYARYFQTANNDVYTAFTICQDNTNQNGLAIAFSSNGSSWDIVNTTISGIVLDAWNHVALVRNGTNISCYINGIGTSLATTSASLYYNASETIIVGGQGSPSRSLRAFISNLRILKGTALYTNNFIPSTGPFTAITNTSLLLNFNNGQVIDTTGRNVAETIGTAMSSATIVKYGSGAMYFAGNGNYLKLPHTPDLSLGSGDWTMECWVYITSAVNYNGIICKRSSGTYDAYNFGTDASNNLWLTMTNSANTWTIGGATLATGVTPNVWHHLAVVRSGNLITGFVDGIAGTTPQSFTGSVYDTGQSVYIANTDGGGNGQNFNGYICDFRLTKGVARYTGNFTPTQILGVNNGPTDWKQAAGGSNFTTAVKTDGTLWTWGSNSYGQLGDNTLNHRSSPVQTVAGGNNWSKVAAGELHAAGVKTDGTLWLWGKNSYAQLGDTTLIHRSVPTQLLGGDPYFNNTSLLLLGNGTNGGQNNTFLDNSILPLAVTRNGNVTQGTFTPYNIYWSNYFDGTDDYLSYTSSTTLNFGTADFTVECWINLGDTVGSKMLISGTATNAFGFRYGIGLNQNQGLSILLAGNTDLEYCYFNFQPNTWYHVAVVRQSSIIKFFVNGAQQNTYGTGGATYNFGAETGVNVGANTSGAEDYIGYISNLRVVKGTAVYTQMFTPSIAPLTAISGTSLLTCVANRFSDGSTNNLTITSNGNTQVTNFHPFRVTSEYNTNANGGSAYFDGTGDSLAIASSLNLVLGAGDFCVEAWVYWTTSGVLDAIFSNLTSSGAGDTQFNVQLTTGNKVQVSGWSTLFLTGATNVASNAWNHIAVCRSGTTLSIFLNGSRDATTTNSTNFSSTNAFYLGDYPVGGAAFTGYISNLRVVKGFSAYDPSLTALTLPTAPLQGIAGTSLLLNFANAQIIDSTQKNNLETLGNAQISTSIVKYGTGSIYFDGTGDYLTIPANSLITFGTNDFTLECWIYPIASTGDNGIWDSRSVDLSATGFTLSLTDAEKIQVYSDTQKILGSSTISLNTWTHIALTRSNGIMRLFVNGTIDGSVTNTQNFIDTNFFIGKGVWANSEFEGYLDEVRITKGIARYTSNFTPSQIVPFTSNNTVWKNIACGNNHTSCIKIDDTLWSWGRNNSGQLGDLTYTNRSSPVQTIAGGSNWKQVSAGINYTTALKTDSTLWSWGNNLYGQLGDGTATDRNSPVQIGSGGNVWKQISAGSYHVAATTFGDMPLLPSTRLALPTGGTITTAGGYRIHTFTSSDTYNSGGYLNVEYLIVAGGGGGGMDMGGGGGGGGVLASTTTISSNTNYGITIGAGGWGAPAGGGGYRGDGVGPQPNDHQFTISATNGANSTVFGLTAIGGGFGGSSYYQYAPNNGNPGSGGSGGGASGYSDGGYRAGGAGTAGQGNNGGQGGPQYYAGGGGGAGAVGASGTNQPNGGAGILNSILGTAYYWGGGGGGGSYSLSTGGNGGIGGGGGGALGTTTGGAGYNNGSPGGGGGSNQWAQTPGGNAGANTGGGGGGGSHYNRTNQGGNGGSGIVIIRYVYP